MAIFDGDIGDNVTDVSVYWLVNESGIDVTVDEIAQTILFKPITNLQFLQCCACNIDAPIPSPDYPDQKRYVDYTVTVEGSFDGERDTISDVYFIPNIEIRANVYAIIGSVRNLDIYGSTFLLKDQRHDPNSDFGRLSINMTNTLYHIKAGDVITGGYFHDRAIELNVCEHSGAIVEEVDGDVSEVLTHQCEGPVMPETVCFTMYYGYLDEEDNVIPVPGIGLEFVSMVDIPLNDGSYTGNLVLRNTNHFKTEKIVVGLINYITGEMTWNKFSLPSDAVAQGYIVSYCGSRRASEDTEQDRNLLISSFGDPLEWCKLPPLGSVLPNTFKYYPMQDQSVVVTDSFVGVNDKGERYGNLYYGNEIVGIIKYDYGFNCSVEPRLNEIRIEYTAMHIYRQWSQLSSFTGGYEHCGLHVNFTYKDKFEVSSSTSTPNFLGGTFVKSDIVMNNVYFHTQTHYLVTNCYNCFIYFIPLENRNSVTSSMTIYKCNNLSVCVESKNGPNSIVFTKCSGNAVVNKDRIHFLDDSRNLSISVDGTTIPSGTDVYEYSSASDAPYPSVTSIVIPATDEQMNDRSYLYGKGFFG